MVLLSPLIYNISPHSIATGDILCRRQQVRVSSVGGRLSPLQVKDFTDRRLKLKSFLDHDRSMSILREVHLWKFNLVQATVGRQILAAETGLGRELTLVMQLQ